MRRRPTRVPVLLLPLLLFALAGCTDAPAEAAAPFEPVSRAVEAEAGILVVEWDSAAPSLSRAVRLDADTLQDLPGEVPMHQGGPLDSSGRFVAVFDPSRGWAERARVYVYDLETWELAWSVANLPSGRLQWHETGLYLWGDHCNEVPRLGGGRCEEPWERGLWRLTPDGAEELVRFDFATYADAPVIGVDGARAYVVGVETEMCCGIDPQGDPFLAILDVEAGEVEVRIPLPGLRIGQPGDWLGSTDHLFGGHYVPGLAVSPDETRAYVVHAEEDRVTVVDLEAGEVDGTHTLEEDAGTATRLGGWLLERFARVAEAKVAAEYLRQVQLTPDGRYLLISGVSVAETPAEVAPDEFVETGPAGLLVVDVVTMEVAYRDGTSGAFTLSPNGYAVLAWERTNRGNRPLGLTILDLRTMEARRTLDGQVLLGAFASPDGRHGYAHVQPFTQRAHRLVAVDLETGEVVAERELEQRGGMDWDWPVGLEFSR